MDLEFLISNMNDLERYFYKKKSTNEYYTYLSSSENYHSIKEKVFNHEKLSDDEWNTILQKMYLLSCKAISEEVRLDFVDRILYFISKIGVRLCQEDSPLYNECLKLMESIASIKKEKDLNLDLFYGYEVTSDSCDETDLDILLQQHQEASSFRSNKAAFLNTSSDSSKGVISSRERVLMNSFNLAYIREKKLFNRYNY